MNYRWFKHDYKARADAKLIDLIMNTGLEGLGAFWCIVEMLYENNGLMQTHCERIAYELHCKPELIKHLIYDSGLFEIDENYFYSNTINERLKIIKDKSKKAVKAASARWNKPHANALQTHCKRNPNIDKIREDKIREDNSNNISPEVQKLHSEPVTDLPVYCEIFNVKKQKVNIYEKDIERWQDTFPNVDIKQELKRAKSWLIDNPKRNKIDIKKFLNNWFGRVQDKGGTVAITKPVQVKTRPTYKPDFMKKLAPGDDFEHGGVKYRYMGGDQIMEIETLKTSYYYSILEY